MKRLNILTITSVVLIGTLSSGVFASEKIARSIMTDANGKECSMVETANVGVNFNNIETELKESRSYIDKKVDDISAIALGLGIEDLEINSLNYNIYSNNSGGCNASNNGYRLNGNISFKMSNSEKAAELMEALNEKNYNVNFNMNAYRQCR